VTDQDIQPDAPSVGPTPGEADAACPVPPAPADAVAAPPSPDQVPDDLKAIVEALIFASPDPLSVKALRKLLPDEPAELVDLAVAALGAQYDHRGGLQLVEVAGGFQIVTRPELHEWVRRLFHERTTQKLSVQALETLAVIAYKQPITAVEITEVRGVNSSGVLGTLIDRKLIKIVGRKPVVGRPFMYATTREFLIRFGLRDLTDLPKVEDMADALGFEPPALGDVEATLPFDAVLEPAPPTTTDSGVAADEEDGGEADGDA
jgi:segregation and condensation protein B